MMPDREKVAKGLHQHCEGSMFDRCGECPYYEIDHESFVCRDMLLNDLNELLKEQQTELCEMLKEQGCATITEPDCRICGQSHCKYYHETRKPIECKSYIRMEGR